MYARTLSRSVRVRASKPLATAHKKFVPLGARSFGKATTQAKTEKHEKHAEPEKPSVWISEEDHTFNAPSGVSVQLMNEVYHILVNEGVFKPKHIFHEVEGWFRLKVPQVYYHLFDTATIANHIHCFMSAKELAEALGTPEQIYVSKTTADKKTRIFMCPATYKASDQVEKAIEASLAEVPPGHTVSIKYLVSQKTITPGGSLRLSFYIVEYSPWAWQATDSTQNIEDVSDISQVAGATFLATETPGLHDLYQSLVDDVKNKVTLAPVLRINPLSRDGTTPVTMTFRHSMKTSFLLRFTEVLRYHHLQVSRKFVEYFANGVVTYIFYLETTDEEKIKIFLNHIQLISLIPGSSLKDLFLEGVMSVEEYAYVSAIRKFIYYFLNTQDETAIKLREALKQDPAGLSRLNSLENKLRREAASTQRIAQCIIENIELCKVLFKDFVNCAHTKPTYNTLLKKEISKVTNELDEKILLAFLTFNSSLLKTNFWRRSKAALSFSLRLDLVSQNYAENPYVIFFVLGQEFQGFHVRFRDIARGGIRVIKSRDKESFLKNMEGQFHENYDLAYTQQMKNKDIPEFGSKGTVLLNREAQGSVQISFQKYIAALLDLLVLNPTDKIINHYGKEEILFCGPDENTADLMEWAALYAKSRGYRYWKAFTTGKPRALGGIPHDLYGMTTRSVHKYVTGCLSKLGLQEEQITKIQTGGPDGDLGSNEIFLSKDKTKAIIDGSGVVFDPAGLDRGELFDLATRRVMIDQFDVSKLGPGGFRVLINENGVELPNGEIVESGVNFRNTFHLHPLAAADLFVPCGGRPAAVNLSNVHQCFNKDGSPRWKVIVEGANLFFTQDARLVLEQAGVVLYKDASANKGGVTSSSLEVLAALAMTDDEHMQYMQVTDVNNVPEFYSDYVEEIQKRIEHNAELEFHAIWKEHERSGVPRCILSDQISKKINQMSDACEQSTLFNNVTLRMNVMEQAIPSKLQSIIPLSTLVNRLPPAYARAIFNSYVASHYVYTYGLSASDFSFLEFITKLSQANKDKTRSTLFE